MIELFSAGEVVLIGGLIAVMGALAVYMVRTMTFAARDRPEVNERLRRYTSES